MAYYCIVTKGFFMSSDVCVPCPIPECKDGYVLVYNAYNKDPLKGEKEPCSFCIGKGFVLISRIEKPEDE